MFLPCCGGAVVQWFTQYLLQGICCVRILQILLAKCEEEKFLTFKFLPVNFARRVIRDSENSTVTESRADVRDTM